MLANLPGLNKVWNKVWVLFWKLLGGLVTRKGTLEPRQKGRKGSAGGQAPGGNSLFPTRIKLAWKRFWQGKHSPRFWPFWGIIGIGPGLETWGLFGERFGLA